VYLFNDEFRGYDRELAQGEIVSLAGQTLVVQPLVVDADLVNS